MDVLPCRQCPHPWLVDCGVLAALRALLCHGLALGYNADCDAHGQSSSNLFGVRRHECVSARPRGTGHHQGGL